MSIRNYIKVARKVKAIVQSIDPEAKVYLFGSAARGEATGASDIDVMVVTSMIERKYEMMVKVYKALDEPVELHVTTPEMVSRWYRRFIKEEELIEA
ncbi:nucleotidyltransferase domain-containing protein [Thermofilum sp.]|uniref:nucleotidyltransferase domain-containing protein n=1 Tax=Thermofilum sp. TaxID=1961369 RepID=UPI00315FFD59|nr:nucleotidyltransferase domain-containing protein [Candidatus Brockarchaeota archaeon]